MTNRPADTDSGISDRRIADSASSAADQQSLFTSSFIRNAQQSGFRDSSQTVLLVAGDGTIVEERQAPENSEADTANSLTGICLDEVWPGDPPGRLVANVKRSIKTRHVESAEIRNETNGTDHDFVFVPHGRDRVLVIARDVSARKSAFVEMEKLAYLDEVTKLPNRQFLLAELENCTNMLRLREGRAAVICFDIRVTGGSSSYRNTTRFDAIFIELASRLLLELRGANALENDDYERFSVAARIERSQFGVILPVIASGADAEGVTKRLLETLQQSVKFQHHEVGVTARAGISLFPQDGTDAQTLYGNAIAAMEDARSSQETLYKFHSGTVRLRTLQRQDVEFELRSALDKDEFKVDFLPIVDAEHREITSVEALLRWPQNVFGPKSIQNVISIAENTGLILPIGDWVLRKSCEALTSWNDRGWSNIRISVNLSVQEFSREDLVERVEAVLNECNIEPSSLDIEITEYSLFRDAMKSYRTCNGLKTLGVGIVVDDYGTGACSLAHLARSPIDALKIDNSFVANALTDKNEKAACAAIAAMAKRLNVRIIAEGVETEEQASMLTQQGCDALQGFLICKPTSADGIASLLSRRANE